MPGSPKHTLFLIYSLQSPSLPGGYFYAHFTDKKTKAQRRSATWPALSGGAADLTVVFVPPGMELLTTPRVDMGASCYNGLLRADASLLNPGWVSPIPVSNISFWSLVSPQNLTSLFHQQSPTRPR